MASQRANANRKLLEWARKTAGYEVDEAARKVRVKPERLEAWETGGAQPTIRQLRELGRVYKRPIAVFYLPEVPRDFTPMRDFRRLPGEVAGVQSPELRFQIRRATARRDAALELYRERGDVSEFSLRGRLSDDPEAPPTVKVAGNPKENLTLRALSDLDEPLLCPIRP